MATDIGEPNDRGVILTSLDSARELSQKYASLKGKVGIREQIALETSAYDAFDRVDHLIHEGVSTGDVSNDYAIRRLGLFGLVDSSQSAELRANIKSINQLLSGNSGEQVLVVDQLQSTRQKGNIYQYPPEQEGMIMVARFRGGVLSDDKLSFDPKKISCEIPANGCKGVKGIFEHDIETQNLPINPTILSDFYKRINGENMFIYVGKSNIDAWASKLPSNYRSHIQEQISRVFPQSNQPSV